MVYLPAGLNRTRSRNASNLSADQQAMGVTPRADVPIAPAQPGGGVPATSEGGFTPSGQAQPSRMTEYLQAQQQQRDMLLSRGEDLRLANLMYKALDPAMPKGFRQLGLRQVSQMLGIDPKGDRAKELINTISGLDPQSLEGIRRGVAQSTDSAEPGELTQMTRGVLTGQVPPDQLLSLASSAMQPPAPAEGGLSVASAGGGAAPDFEPPMGLGMGGAGGFGPGGIGGTAESDVTQAQAPGQAPVVGAPLPPRRQQPAAMPETASPTTDVPRADESHVPYRMREVEPEFANTLGLGLDQRYRLIDVQKAGWNRIPSDPTERRKVFTEIGTAQTGMLDTLSMASVLAGLVRGKPEALDASIWVPGLGTIGINPSSLGSKFNAFVDGILNVAGVPQLSEADRNKFIQDVQSMPKNQRFGEMVTNKIIEWANSTGQRISDTAELNARINSVMVPLAFAMAAAKGQTGRFLSDRDVEFQLRELGQSNNPQQFIAAITDMAQRLNQQYDTRMRVLTGAPVPLTGAISPDVAQNIRIGGIAPAAIAELVGGGAAGPQATERPPATQGRSPGVPPTVGTQPVVPPSDPNNPYPAPDYMNEGGRIPVQPGAPIRGPQPGAIPRNPAQPATEVPPAEPARQGAPTAPAGPRTIQRAGPTLEQEEAAALGRIQEDRAAALEQRGQNRRRLEIAESQEARAQRAEVEQRRLRIQQAFASIGNALKGAISVGGGGGSAGGGGDQDPNAFRIAPPPQRRAPTPVSAAPYQPQPPARRR